MGSDLIIDTFNVISSVFGHVIAVVALIISIMTMTSAKRIKEQMKELQKSTLKKYDFSKKKDGLKKTIKQLLKAIELGVCGYKTVCEIIKVMTHIKGAYSEWDVQDKDALDKYYDELTTLSFTLCSDITSAETTDHTIEMQCISCLNLIEVIIDKGEYSI